jgi:hypothetical protein
MNLSRHEMNPKRDFDNFSFVGVVQASISQTVL